MNHQIGFDSHDISAKNRQKSPKWFTSVWLIKYHKSTANSEITMTDIRILKPVSKSPIDPPMIPEKISAEISVIIEISVILYFFSIIEYQIYSPIFSILQTIFGQNTEKSKKNIFSPPKNIIPTHNHYRIQKLYLVLLLCPHTNHESIAGPSSHQFHHLHPDEAPTWSSAGLCDDGKPHHTHVSNPVRYGPYRAVRENSACASFALNEEAHRIHSHQKCESLEEPLK